MRVALVQLASPASSAPALEQLAVRLAAVDPAESLDLVVLPEASMHDFGPPGLDLAAVAEPLDGPFVAFLAEHAQRLGTTIVAGMFEATDDLPYNTLVAVAPDGSLAAAYRKVHLYDSFGYRESDRLRAGSPAPAMLDLADRRLGLMTCYDLRFPEMGRLLVDAGADTLVVPAAWVAGEHKLDHWRTLLRARAIENTVHVLAAAQCGPDYTGHSLVVDPMGLIVAEGGDGPEIVRADIDLADVERAREVNPSLDNRRIR